MAEFLPAFNSTSRHEGGYSNRRGDRGGETYRGISRVHFPDWEGWALIDEAKSVTADVRGALGRWRALLSPMVVDFYEGEFWRPLMLGNLSDQAIANEIYDTAVNMGKRVAARFIQEACNAVNYDTGVVELEVDGVIGRKTTAVVNALCAKGYGDVLLVAANIRQGAGYWRIIDADPRQKENFRGWLRARVAL